MSKKVVTPILSDIIYRATSRDKENVSSLGAIRAKSIQTTQLSGGAPSIPQVPYKEWQVLHNKVDTIIAMLTRLESTQNMRSNFAKPPAYNPVYPAFYSNE